MSICHIIHTLEEGTLVMVLLHEVICHSFLLLVIVRAESQVLSLALLFSQIPSSFNFSLLFLEGLLLVFIP